MYKTIVSIRSATLVYLTHRVALPVLKLIRKPEKFPHTKDELQQLPDGILGKDLINMLNAKKLPLLSYYVKHDIKHILLGYDTTDEGEVCLQCFMLGNGHISFPVFITVVFGFVTIPEHWSKFIQAYQRGKRSAKISHWQWFQIIHQPTQSLINIINRNEKN